MLSVVNPIGARLAGAGIARVKAIGVQDLLANGLLVDLLPDWPGQAFPLYALYPAGPHPAAKIRAFIDFVVERIGRQRRSDQQLCA
jgi:DNA-binding transcriptional LysR family regulator